MAVTSSRTFTLAAPDTHRPVSSAESIVPLKEGGERRCLMAGLQLRAARSGKGPGTIVGYAAVFGKFSQDLGGFTEKIAPGAFSAVLNQDVRALVNHSADKLLGRSKSGTLRMVEDELGLRVEIDLPDTQLGRDTAVEVGRGDMDGMSFSFTTDVDQWDWSGQTPIRTLVKIRDLYDVGPVVFPAYTDTSAAMRSLDRSKPALESAPAPEPASRSDYPSFDPLPLFHFRLRVEQASVLP